jgi:hypothetical protein
MPRPCCIDLPIPKGSIVERCLTCQYFDYHAAKSSEAQSTQWGQCRRAAPRLSPLNAKPHMIEGVWPHVRDDDWCGEYKGRAQRLQAQLTELMNDPRIAPLEGESNITPLFIPIGQSHEISGAND